MMPNLLIRSPYVYQYNCMPRTNELSTSLHEDLAVLTHQKYFFMTKRVAPSLCITSKFFVVDFTGEFMRQCRICFWAQHTRISYILKLLAPQKKKYNNSWYHTFFFFFFERDRSPDEMYLKKFSARYVTRSFVIQ